MSAAPVACRRPAAERAESDERAAMAFNDPGCPREPELTTQDWHDWWLPNDDRWPALADLGQGPHSV